MSGSAERSEETPAEPSEPAVSGAVAPARAASPEVIRLRALFDVGNFAAVRDEGAALLATDLESAVRADIEELLRRTAPGRAATLVFGIGACLVLGVAGYWVLNTHG